MFMKKLLITPLFLTLIFSSCSDEIEIERCIQSQLERLQMEPYTGQALECHFYLREFAFEGKAYYILDNNCADIAPYPTDCAGDELCKDNDSSLCVNFFEKAQEKGIVGIRIED
ncbi:MAG: hypothetical protein ACJAT1_000568 [Marivirga sp.]|jgi:hypothetical protein